MGVKKLHDIRTKNYQLPELAPLSPKIMEEQSGQMKQEFNCFK
jgi:hypothetical protein